MSAKSLTQIPPWLKRPYELIELAVIHYHEGGEINERETLISFDNAIELCIDIYINLPEEIRDDVRITKEEASKAHNNFYEKVKLLEKIAISKKFSGDIPVKEIIWYHKLRNEMYHSGNGFVPEIHVLRGAKSASLLVFKVLFNIDLSQYFRNISIAKDEGSTTNENVKQIIQELKTNGYYQAWHWIKNDTYHLICKLPESKYGIYIIKFMKEDDTWLIVTRYIIPGISSDIELEKHQKALGQLLVTENNHPPFPFEEAKEI